MALLFIALFLSGVFVLMKLKTKFKKTFNFRVLLALVMGLLFGGIIQILFGATSTTTATIAEFTNIFSGLYIKLLQLIIIPLILVSITVAIIEAPKDSNLGRNIAQILSVLLITVSIAAAIGIAIVPIANIDGEKLLNTYDQTEEYEEKYYELNAKQEALNSMSYDELILAPIPSNFGFLVGNSSTAALSTVLFGGFLGYAIIQIRKRKPEKPAAFIEFLVSLKEVVLSLVREILKLTPYAVFALMTQFMAISPLSSLGELGKFVVATYVAIFIMFVIHLLIVFLFKVSPLSYFKKIWPVLVFGFGSRSSMAAMPLNIEAQVEELGVPEATANLSASLGATIGQNGCAGIYPAMIATMAAMTNPDFTMSIGFIFTLIVVIMISSFGIAGVGGGATFAAIAVLSIMNLPITLAAVLVSVEPLLDMARTALNISDAMVAGTVTARLNKELNEEKLKS